MILYHGLTQVRPLINTTSHVCNCPDEYVNIFTMIGPFKYIYNDWSLLKSCTTPSSQIFLYPNTAVA